MAVVPYKPDHPRFPKMEVGEGLPDEVESLQVAIAVSKGYTGHRPDAELPWMRVSDVSGVLLRGAPAVVLSPTKFLRHLSDIGLAMRFLRRVRSDLALLDWWVDDRTASFGSPEFARLAAMMGVPKDVLREHCMAGMTVDGR